MTLWGVSPGSKFKDAYLSVPDSFEGQVTIPSGTTWLNGVFGPYTVEYGMGYSEVGGITEGGGACDIISMVSETLASAGLTVDSYSPHPTPIPGVDSRYSIAVATSRNSADPSTKNGADVRVVNDYGPVVLHWTVDGDSLTLTVTSGPTTNPLPQVPGIVPTNIPGTIVVPTVKTNPAPKEVHAAAIYQSFQTAAVWGLVVLAVLWLIFAGPKVILRIGKPRTQGEVARKKSLWRGAIEVAVIVGVVMTIGAYFYAQWQWPDVLAYRTRLFRDWLNGESSVPNALVYGMLAFWLGLTLLGRLRQARGAYEPTAETKKKRHGQTFVVVTLLVAGVLAGMYFIPSLYSPPPAVASAPVARVPSALPEFQITYWNGSEVRFYAPQDVWDAAVTAYQKNGTCDPRLVVAVAFSESSVYNNTAVSPVGAAGVWQFMPGTWNDYWPVGPDQPDRTNIPAAADAACRKISDQGLPSATSEAVFVDRFAYHPLKGSCWNQHEGQAKFVWTLWQQLIQQTANSPTPTSAP